MDNKKFVELLYVGVLRRPGDAAGVKHYTEGMNKGRSALSVLEEFYSCDEFKSSTTTLFVPPGHFYSPIVNPRDVETAYLRNWHATPTDLPEISLNASGMESLWNSWLPLIREIPFPDEPQAEWRYYFVNDQFSWGDASVYYAMLRSLRPRRIIEVGSGFSSALALDVVDRFLNELESFTFIEPYPGRLQQLLRKGDLSRSQLIEQKVQDAPLSVFEQLESGDILFIDSTHVMKTESDVAYELFHVLPALKSGTYVHFHDVCYPFEYPPEWVIAQNRSWNEVYALRAFLMGNDGYEVVFFNDYFRRRFPELAGDASTPFHRNPGGSIWLRKR